MHKIISIKCTFIISGYEKVLRMLVCSFLCNVNDTRALIGLCLLVTSHCGQIIDPRDSKVFIIAHIVIGLSLHTHSFIHLRFRFFIPLNTCSGEKSARQFPWNLLGKSIIKKIFDGEIVIRTLPTTLLQIFCKIIVISKFIFKNPDNSRWRNSKP